MNEKKLEQKKGEVCIPCNWTSYVKCHICERFRDFEFLIVRSGSLFLSPSKILIPSKIYIYKN